MISGLPQQATRMEKAKKTTRRGWCGRCKQQSTSMYHSDKREIPMTTGLVIARPVRLRQMCAPFPPISIRH